MAAGQAIQQTEQLSIDAQGLVTVTYVWPDKPWTVNERLRGTSRGATIAYSKRVKEWRQRFAELAANNPHLLWCDVVVDHETATRRSVDIAAVVLAAKAAIDGIVDAGVLPDDTPKYVRSHRYNPPVYTGRDALVITLVGPGA